MDPATLATGSIALAAPYLGKIAKTAADEASAAIGRKLADWVTTKFTGPGEPEALARLESGTDDPTARVLAKTLLELKLKDDAALAGELEGMVKEAEAAGMIATVIGDNNQTVLVDGSGNTITLGKSG